MKGYEVTPRYDKSKNLVGYTIGKNSSVFKASEIGRRYMASQLETTWKKLHPQPAQVKVKPATPTVTPSNRPSRPVAPNPTSTQTKAQTVAQPKPVPPNTVSSSIQAKRPRRSGFPTLLRTFSSMKPRFHSHDGGQMVQLVLNI